MIFYRYKQITSCLPFIFWLNTSLIFGILWSYYSSSLIYIMLYSICVGIYSLRILLKYNIRRSLILTTIHLSVFSLGACRISYQQYTLSTFFMRYTQSQDINAYITSVYSHEGKTYRSMYTAYLPDYSAYIQIYSKEKAALQEADYVCIHHACIAKTYDKNIQLFLHKYSIKGSVFCIKLRYTHKTDKCPVSFIYDSYIRIKKIIQNIYMRSVTSLKNHMNKDMYTLFLSLFLGHTHPHNHHHRKVFDRWGISHYLARSGLHIALLIGILHIFFMYIPCPLVIRYTIVWFILSCYACLSISSVSFIRTYMLYIIYMLGVFMNVPAYPLHALSLVSFACLLYNPFFILCIDFQLSFFLTYGLMLFYEHRKRVLPS
jgi:ComEC/Rec2-related protein